MTHNDPLTRLIKEHKEVSEFVENIDQIMDFLHEEDTHCEIKPMEDFFNKNIIGHFEFEEKKIFPPCLLKIATPESVKLILELQKEHGIMLTKLAEFHKIISENDIPFDKETCTKINVVAREILDLLLLHASKEDDKLLPTLKENRQIFEL